MTLLTPQEKNCGRLEIRVLSCLEVTPTQVNFPGARMVASLESRTHRDGDWHAERVFLISSRSLGELQAEGMLALKRRYWVIENRLHHCLDITLREDWSRVRNPNSA